MNISPDMIAQAIKGLAQKHQAQGLPTSIGTKTGAGGTSFDANLLMAQKLMGMENMGAAKDSESMEFGLCKDALALEAMVTLSKLDKTAEAEPMPNLLNDLRAKAAKAYGKALGPQAPEPQAPTNAPQAPALDMKLPVTGELSAKFESGHMGPAAVSWDKTGGTSYGTFQLSSKAGTVDMFMDFLKQHMPEWADRLAQAGPADTGSDKGAMPKAWKAIAAENSETFANLQQQFITDSHYGGAAKAILEATGIDVDKLPPALREVVFSTAVQHGAGGAASIFSKAFEAATGAHDAGDLLSSLIDNIYKSREKDFPNSTPQVRESVKNRLGEEKELALAMLSESGLSALI